MTEAHPAHSTGGAIVRGLLMRIGGAAIVIAHCCCEAAASESRLELFPAPSHI